MGSVRDPLYMLAWSVLFLVVVVSRTSVLEQFQLLCTWPMQSDKGGSNVTMQKNNGKMRSGQCVTT